MEISSIKLVNFKGFLNEEFNFNEEITVFVGPNNSGKTTILEAIALLFNVQHAGIKVYLNKSLATGTCKVEVSIKFTQDEWDKAAKLIQHEFQTTLSESTLTALSVIPVVGEWQASYSEGRQTRIHRAFKLPTEDVLVQFEANEKKIIRRAINFLSGQNLSALFGSLVFLSTERRLQPSEQWMPYNELFGRGDYPEFVRNRLYHLQRKNPEKFEEVRRKLMSTFQIEGFTVEKDEDTGSVNLIVTERGKQCDINEMGGGTRSFVLLFSYLLFPGISVALIDEPDINMHPALVRELVRYLRGLSKHTQLILTSHHETFINELALSEIYRVEFLEDSGSKVRRLDGLQDQWKLLEELGVPLSPSEKAETAFLEETQIEQRGKVIDEIKNINMVFGKIMSTDVTLLSEDIHVVKELLIPCKDADAFRRKIGSLALLFENEKLAELRKILGKSNVDWKSIKLIEYWLEQKNVRCPEVIEVWRKIVDFRNSSYPYHHEDVSVVNLTKYFGHIFPPDYAKLWDSIIMRFIDSLRKFRKLLSSFP